MNGIEIYSYKDKDVKDALAIISFPTVGLVGNIVANFLVQKLELELIAAFVSDDFYPAAIVQNGLPTPPLRIYAGDNVCGPEDVCDQIVVITSELPLKASSYYALADTIIDWCKDHGCKIVATIEGVNTSDKPIEEDAKVFYVASNEDAAKHLKGLPVEPMEGGMVSGLSGILLYKGVMQGFSVTCLLAEAHEEFPDSRSAFAVLKVLDKMVPQIKMEPEPVLQQAQEIEEQIKKAMGGMKNTGKPALPEAPMGMYG